MTDSVETKRIDLMINKKKCVSCRFSSSGRQSKILKGIKDQKTSETREGTEKHESNDVPIIIGAHSEQIRRALKKGRKKVEI